MEWSIVFSIGRALWRKWWVSTIGENIIFWLITMVNPVKISENMRNM